MTENAAQGKARLLTFKSRADARLAELSALWQGRALPATGSPKPKDLLHAVTDLTSRGGKRVRPALVFYAAKCFDQDLDEGALLDAALSVELLQTYLLIHDDLMDDDSMRRGGPSAHVMLTEMARDERVGRSLAILAGDLGCALAQELLLGDGIPQERLRPALAELTQMQWEVIQGQHLDIVKGAPPEQIHDAKTASYTTRGPVRLGGALAGASAPQMERLTAYGTPLGRAFQLRDDLLGVFGDHKRLGKPVGADLREGKRTDLVEYALQQATDGQRSALEVVCGNTRADDEQIGRAVEVIKKTGAKRRCEEMIETLTAEALSAIEGSGWHDQGLSFLRGIATLLACRDR